MEEGNMRKHNYLCWKSHWQLLLLVAREIYLRNYAEMHLCVFLFEYAQEHTKTALLLTNTSELSIK